MTTIKTNGDAQTLSAAQTSGDVTGAGKRSPALVYEPSSEPLATIEASGSFSALNLRELWAYRELLYFLIWRDVKIRYKQTALGAAWAIIQPVVTMIIFTVIFSRVAGIRSEGVPYPLYAFAALLPWTFFSNAVTNSGNSLVGSAHLITKVYFPRLLIPAAAVGAGLVDFAVAFVMVIPLMIYYRVNLTTTVFLLPLAIILMLLLALGMGLWLSALNVKYRDVRFAVPFLMQIWMFVSPIAYPSSVVPAKWQVLYSLNPIGGIVDGFRSGLLGLPVRWGSLAISAAITVALLLYGSFMFRRMEKTFADVI
jgi:lipopolysaccharide transport system permease protein